MAKNLVATPGRSTEGISELEDLVVEVKMENRGAAFMPRIEGIGEIMDQEVECINAIENLVAIPGQNTERVSGLSDQTTEDVNVT